VSDARRDPHVRRTRDVFLACIRPRRLPSDPCTCSQPDLMVDSTSSRGNPHGDQKIVTLRHGRERVDGTLTGRPPFNREVGKRCTVTSRVWVEDSLSEPRRCEVVHSRASPVSRKKADAHACDCACTWKRRAALCKVRVAVSGLTLGPTPTSGSEPAGSH
jgi:hypothetical protein